MILLELNSSFIFLLLRLKILDIASVLLLNPAVPLSSDGWSCLLRYATHYSNAARTEDILTGRGKGRAWRFSLRIGATTLIEHFYLFFCCLCVLELLASVFVLC